MSEVIQYSDIPLCDTLRNSTSASTPDERINGCNFSLEDQLQLVAPFTLNITVPLDIRTHFETAKNLFLYAWFVYRFYPIAEQQALTTLEFSLRLRLNEEMTINPKAGLSKLLNIAHTEGFIKNEKIKYRVEWAKKLAHNRYLDKMIKLKATQIYWNNPSVQYTDEDLSYDWISQFIATLPSIRNQYAHGASTLYPNVTHTFEVVSDLINQLYPLIE